MADSDLHMPLHFVQSISQTIPLFAWFKLANDTVTEPYLDEVFHIRQAQEYCNGNFDVWDPKITTPPGLYLVSYLLSLIYGCSVSLLRSQSLYALICLSNVVVRSYITRGAKDGAWINNSIFSITLFPPLFFFSALYYTDATSTLSVLGFYNFFLYSEYNRKPLWLRAPVLVILGAVSLLFRQTNVFWVTIFPAGIVLVNQIDRGQRVVKDSMHQQSEGFGDSLMSVARTSYKMGTVYDLPVRDAWIEDYGKTIISIVACIAGVATRPTRLPTLLQAVSPFLIILTLFAGFIIWNDGVVLGDKSNHVATPHLPQMLYIWPFFTFFSWPMLYQYLVTVPIWLVAKLPGISSLEATLIFKRRQLLPRPWLTALFILLACGIVHFNTIVHPFTLADNRHYNFYVFRLLMRPAWVKYAVTPIYIFCGWACIQSLGARPPPTPPSADEEQKEITEAIRSGEQPAKPLDLPNGTVPAKTSFVLIWLATSSLQLITAPLVEPRYFILPWIFWRMHLPLQREAVSQDPAPTNQFASWKAWVASLDHRMVLEVSWLLCVNAVTGYIFLRWTFEWPQEPGKAQRFMW